MKFRYIVIAALIFGLMAFAVWRSSKVIDDLPVLEKTIGPILARHGLDDANLTKEIKEEAKAGMGHYITTYREYNASRSFDPVRFEQDLKARLKSGRFRITKSKKTSGKNIYSQMLEISAGRIAVMSIKVNKKKREAMPPSVKKFKNPRIAIVMDDFGYNMNNIETLFSIKEPVTLSILPSLRYSKQIAESAESRGYEVILHMPMESHNEEVREEADTIRTGMSEADVLSRLAKSIASVPGLDGVSNHTGSKATEDKDLMVRIFKYLKPRNLYFFDSLTSQKSICREAASSVGIRYARRDMFLDNSSDPEYIEKQLMTLERLAFKTGKVIAICHDRKNTVSVLTKMMPEMAGDGIRFVYLSELTD